MLPPRHALLAALVCCACLFGCVQNNPPSLTETLPAEAVLDLPDVGLVEPRVEMFPAPLTNATVALAAPELRADTDLALLPKGTRTVSSVREVLLQIAVEGAAVDQELTLELLQPGGAAYEVRSARVGGDASATYRVQFVLPVAATAIDRANLTGTWTANFLLAGHPLSTTTFELLPQ
jgi:hypothetical protein